jgi:transcriptional regulator with XRE-family HTH domain
MAEIRRVTLPYLREWRQHRLLSQAELGEASSLSLVTISHLENGGQANFATVGKLAKALNITREQLVRERPPES